MVWEYFWWIIQAIIENPCPSFIPISALSLFKINWNKYHNSNILKITQKIYHSAYIAWYRQSRAQSWQDEKPAHRHRLTTTSTVTT